MNKQKLYEIIDTKAPLLTELSDRIWEYAELSMLEFKSTAAYVQVLAEEGFEVTENLCNIPTAFSGTYGSGKPVVGILGEYDALSGLSQAAGATERIPIEENGCGQGCGHNLLGVGALGAAIAIKEAIKSGELSGTVIFYGCPGEEGCAGKTFMARDGIFAGLDAAITWHPWTIDKYTQEELRMFEMRPGITGWAQVNGRKDVEWHKRIRLNIWYIDHCTFLLDVKIFFMIGLKFEEKFYYNGIMLAQIRHLMRMI